MTRLPILVCLALAAAPYPVAAQPAASNEGVAVFSPVTWERLVKAADEPHNWLMYNGTLDSQRYSRLDQIDRGNVSELELKWAHHIPQLDRAEGSTFTGGGTEAPLPIENYQSAIRAIDPTTGDTEWEFPITPRTRAGVLATAGDLVFSASIEGYFYALDATTGEPLWHIALGGPVHAQPMTYAVNGQQYVTMTIGNTVYTFGLDE